MGVKGSKDVEKESTCQNEIDIKISITLIYTFSTKMSIDFQYVAELNSSSFFSQFRSSCLLRRNWSSLRRDQGSHLEKRAVMPAGMAGRQQAQNRKVGIKPSILLPSGYD